MKKCSPREKHSKTEQRTNPVQPEKINYDQVTHRVPGRNFYTRRQTEIRLEQVEIQPRDFFEIQTKNLTNRGAPVRFLKDLATLMKRKDLPSFLKTNGFIQGDDDY